MGKREARRGVTMSELINSVLNSNLKDLPHEVYLQFNYSEYSVEINFQDDPPYIQVSEKHEDEYDTYVSSVTIYSPDPETRIIDFVEDAIKLIEKYKAKTSKKKKKHSEEA